MRIRTFIKPNLLRKRTFYISILLRKRSFFKLNLPQIRTFCMFFSILPNLAKSLNICYYSAMFNIAIIEDMAIQRELIDKYIQEWSASTKSINKTYSFSSAEQFLFEHEDYPEINLLLLDIEMLRLSGVDLAKKIRKTDEKISIIFITANPDYMQDGFDVEAFNYLLKPIKKEKLFECLTKLAKRIKQHTRKSIVLSVDGEKIKIYQDEIISVESISHDLKITTAKQVLKTRMTLSQIEEELDADHFIKTHRAFIVNLSKIKQIQKSLATMENSEEIPISKREYKTVNEKFIKLFTTAES